VLEAEGHFEVTEPAVLIGYSHTTTVVCEYSRYVGEILPDPWKTLAGFSSSLNTEEQLKHFNSGTTTN